MPVSSLKRLSQTYLQDNLDRRHRRLGIAYSENADKTKVKMVEVRAACEPPHQGYDLRMQALRAGHFR